MILDLILCCITLIFGVLGYFSGFAMQAMRLTLLLIAYLFCGLIGSPLGVLLANKFDIDPIIGQAVSTFAVFSVLYLLTSTVGWIVIRRNRQFKDFKDLEHKIEDKCLGAGIGLFKAFTIGFLLLCTLVLVESKYRNTLNETGVWYGESFLVGMARDYNLIAYQITDDTPSTPPDREN